MCISATLLLCAFLQPCFYVHLCYSASTCISFTRLHSTFLLPSINVHLFYSAYMHISVTWLQCSFLLFSFNVHDNLLLCALPAKLKCSFLKYLRSSHHQVTVGLS